jgi:hypothetical protein
MPVFDGTIKTARKVKDPKTDKNLPPAGGLSWGSITGDSALDGTTGADCKKITGDRWQQIQGNLTEKYSGNKDIDVKGKHTEQIVGNRSITVSAGNIERNISSGKVSDTVAMSYELQAGTDVKTNAGMNVQTQAGMNMELQAGVEYSVTTMQGSISAGALLDIEGAMVQINS